MAVWRQNIALLSYTRPSLIISHAINRVSLMPLKLTSSIILKWFEFLSVTWQIYTAKQTHIKAYWKQLKGECPSYTFVALSNPIKCVYFPHSNTNSLNFWDKIETT